MDHQHTLQLNDSGSVYMCSGCKEIGLGSNYTCQNSTCNYILHEECAEPVKHAVHPFFKNSTFEFYEKAVGGGFCDACGKDLLGFFYCSRTGEALHPCCFNLEKNISDILTLSHQLPSDCVHCKQRHVVRNNFQGWSYVVNSNGKTCVHVSCFKDMILLKLTNRSKGRMRSFLKFTGKLALNMLIDIATGDITNSIYTIIEALSS
ncbi:unnamed protein product [Lathyrus oleraceus]|uniref:DC1 domain-containing protein n=1 Tax=Pisum sativum TaxID=3888 RepID=A0A9D4Y1P3_PEA|nr:hypothetical protein KIW84_035529 [Pisum sativum]